MQRMGASNQPFEQTAKRSGLTVLAQTAAVLSNELASAEKNCCLLPLGWGGGFLSNQRLAL